MDKPKWLDHLNGVVPETGYGNRMSMYLIALEAWRRGLKVKFYKIDNPDNKMYIRYIISDGLVEHKFESSQGDKLTESAFKACENKDLTKKILSNKGIPVPQGQRFQPNSDTEGIINYAKTLQFPVVVKPVAENAGKGVFTNILGEEELISTIDHVRDELGYKDIIVEKHFSGTEYRILIVNDRIVGAVNRRPANIQGDGDSTIEELINQKNASKKNNPIIATKMIEIDKEVISNLDLYGLTLESIPPKNEVIYLRNKSNVSRGGDPIDVTDQLTHNMRDIALKATQAIEGLDICGLDMLVNEDDKSCVVIEINTKPMIGLHMYPIQGEARDVVSPIIDYYFPHTKQFERSNLYFDFEAALSPIRNYLTTEVKLTPIIHPKYLSANRFLIKGEKLDSEFRNKIRRKALQLGLNGRVEEIKSNKKMQIIVATNNIKKLEELILYIECLPTQHGIKSFKKFKWNQPVNVGFVTLTISHTATTIQKLQKDLKKQRKVIEQKEEQIKKNEQEQNKLEKEMGNKNKSILRLDREKEALKQKIAEFSSTLEAIYSSRSWKITHSLRKFVAKKTKKM